MSLEILKPENGDPVHQYEFECENCGNKGLIQSVKEPEYCPTCEDGLELWEEEFTIIKGDLPMTDPIIVPVKEKIVYKYRDRPKSPAEDRRYGFRGYSAPTEGHRGVRKDPNHKIVNTPPIITSVMEDEGKREYTVDCGYTGHRSSVTNHLQTWHGMSHREANTAVLIRNHEWQDNRHRLLVHECGNHGLHPITAKFLGYVKNYDGDRLYRYEVSCGFVGARTSLIRHLTLYHGYDKREAQRFTMVRGQWGLSDKTNLNVHLKEDPLK